MKKIIVKYRELALGELTYNDGYFCYNVYEENIKKAYQNAYPIMLYKVDSNFVEPVLPNSLDNLIPDENTKLFNDAQMLAQDNDFEKLYKLAKLPLYDEGLYVEIEE